MTIIFKSALKSEITLPRFTAISTTNNTMVQRRRSSPQVVNISSMAFLEQPKKTNANRSTNALGEGMATCSRSSQEFVCTSAAVKKTRSHHRSKSSASLDYKAGSPMEDNNIYAFIDNPLRNKDTITQKQTTKCCECPSNNNALEQCIYLNQDSSSFTDKLRDENSNSVLGNRNFLEKIMLNNTDKTADKLRSITTDTLISPSKSKSYNNNISSEKLITFNTPEVVASITHVLSNPKKKMMLSVKCNSTEIDSLVPKFIACNKIPFHTYGFEVSNKNNSSFLSNKRKEYDYQNNNLFRPIPMKPRSRFNIHSMCVDPTISSEDLCLPNF